MSKGKKYYNKETERARQLNQQNKAKYTGKIKNRLREKIYGEEKINSESTKDMINKYEMESKNSVFMKFKNKHLHIFRDFYFKEKEKEAEAEAEQRKIEEIFKNVDKFKCFKFKSLEDAYRFLETFEDIQKNLMPYYNQPFPEYHILKEKDSGQVIGLFNKQYFEEEEKIEFGSEDSDGDEFIDSEAEAIITKRYYDFQNNIKEEGKDIIIKTKDGVVATRKENYNYMDTNFKIIDE